MKLSLIIFAVVFIIMVAGLVFCYLLFKPSEKVSKEIDDDAIEWY